MYYKSAVAFLFFVLFNLSGVASPDYFLVSPAIRFSLCLIGIYPMSVIAPRLIMEQPQNSKLIFIIPVIVAISSLALFWMGLVNGWFGPAGHCASEFCEASRPGLIKQPCNTWSNISFILAGLSIAWLLMRGSFDANNNGMTRDPFYGIFYSSLVVLLGPGSMAMHATTGALGGFFDMLSMYLIASFTVAYAAQRFFRLGHTYFAGIFVVVLAFCIWADGAPYHIIFWFFGDTVFACLIALTISMEAANVYIRGLHHDIVWVLLAIGSLVAAFLIWNLTKTGTPLCDPYSLFQGHAVWHILNAVATFCLFRYYVSEHKERQMV